MASSQTDEIAQALWYVGPGRAEILDERLVAPMPRHVRVRAEFGGLSRGSEALVLAGRVPESEFERMRAPFMGGIFPFPVKYGYATVGRVEAGPADMIGKNVFTLHPHQSLFDIPADDAFVLPDDVPSARGVLAANMETALNATWDAGPLLTGRIAVVGGGVVGSLVAYLYGKIASADVTLVDVNPARAGIARKLGVGFAVPQAARGDCDLVFHASASEAGLATALSLAGFEASVVEMSWYGDRPVAAPLGGAFHSRRLRLISSQVGQVAPSHRKDWTHARRLAAAIALLADERLDALLAPPVMFSELPARIGDILASNSGILCQLIRYR